MNFCLILVETKVAVQIMFLDKILIGQFSGECIQVSVFLDDFRRQA